MRTLRCAVVVLAVVACKKADNAAADSSAAAAAAAAPASTPAATTAAAPAPGAKLAGTWEGMGTMEGMGKPQPFTVVVDSSGNSKGIGGGDTVQYHSVSSTDTSFVVESAPYTPKGMKDEVVEHIEGRLVGDSAVGTSEMRPTKAGGKVMKGSWHMHRAK